MISFHNITKKYTDGTTAVDSISFTINKGEFFVLIGPSGSGKTTTLKMINRLIPLTDGTITIDGKRISDYNIHELRWNMGYVLQQIALFPHMTIEENIAIVPELKKWPKENIHRRVSELLEMVGLDPNTYRNRKPSELSGGEQQRVGVVRALAADPDIVLMDEPFSALDPISREKLQEDLLHLQKTIKKTIVFVTHDMNEAMKLADRICLMNDGQIIQLGTPDEIINQPENDFVREFVGTQVKIGTDFHLENLMTSFTDDNPNLDKAIPHSASLEEVIAQLAKQDKVLIKKNGTVIGSLNRQILIQHLAKTVKQGGHENV
ncbi:ABC transporter ATP-binding protein [Paucisalibacillus globulus]|uniref:ABC transporter ATP-binding protein n=1 Tax=Paucisalibacillus globulus TaxID=351095 RepID=UPI000427B071|nr:ABC transporter ATP-binding protein [Paucisalibacillus globulus]